MVVGTVLCTRSLLVFIKGPIHLVSSISTNKETGSQRGFRSSQLTHEEELNSNPSLSDSNT